MVASKDFGLNKNFQANFQFYNYDTHQKCQNQIIISRAIYRKFIGEQINKFIQPYLLKLFTNKGAFKEKSGTKN